MNLPEKMDRLDILRAHLLEGAEITLSQEEMLEKYKAAFTWMSKVKSPGEAIQKVSKHYDLSYPQAAKVVRDAIQLYGDVNAYSKKGLQQLMFEKFLRLASRAEHEGDFRAAEKLMDKACKVQDLYNPKEAKSASKATINIFFSDDPAVLEEQNTQDIDHEEYDNE